MGDYCTCLFSLDDEIQLFLGKQRLKRIKDRLKEMNHWWNKVMSEEEEHNDEKEIKKVWFLF